ncbi:twin-arginine translocation signal domain-containing protein [Marinifilum fragile]|uniref:twin-arginine translocation signal domain-containing protein n=1 Tax=Marinifilum fragile TaxID=570161 RepID=UPI002AA5EE47|nr:twin-arginine translocation signal domain-containing protein [Marinifilum fragile]
MSNQNNTNRRGFLQKLGLTVGAAAFIDTEVLADVNLNKYSNVEDREAFLNRYEKWVDQYIDVVEEEKKNKENIANKKRIMELSEEANGWQEQIKEYIKHDDFKSKYIEVSKRFANSITPELEA